MGRRYSNQEIERIMKQDLVLSEKVEQGIQNAYRQLGLDETERASFVKRRRGWRILAAVAVLTAGSSLVVLAASQFLSADLVKKKDSVVYDIKVDQGREAHEIEVEPSYIPQGYVLGDENSPYGGKWHNEETDGTITIVAMNAAELDEMIRLGDAEMLTNGFAAENIEKETEINGRKVTLFVSESGFVDSDGKVMHVDVFDEEEGCLVTVYNYDHGLPQEEIIKVAENLQIHVLDSTVPYKTDAEIEAVLAERKAYMAEEKRRLQSRRLADENFYSVGEELEVPYVYPDTIRSGEEGRQGEVICEAGSRPEDIRYTVESVEIKDCLPASEYPAENYMDPEAMEEWIEEDGSLKPHERYHYEAGESGQPEGEPVLETVNSKYVVVRMKVKNCNTGNEEAYEKEINVAPYLKHLQVREDGVYGGPAYDDGYRPANEGYSLQVDGFPVYFDKIYHTEGIERLKDPHFVPLAEGEEMEYTLAYVVDEDRLEDAYLYFYQEYNGTEGGWKVEEGRGEFVYVKVLQ